MVHLLVHIVAEVKDLGPAFLHTMFPFEQMNGTVQGCVHNKARSDGSIVHAYLIEVCISFCKNVINDDQSLGLPLKRHAGRLEGVGHSHLKRDLNVDIKNHQDDFERAHTVVLPHADIINLWLQTHKETLRKEHGMAGRQRTEARIIREHNSKFASWFKEQIWDKPLSTGIANANLIYALAVGPACTVATYQSYDINGYTSYT